MAPVGLAFYVANMQASEVALWVDLAPHEWTTMSQMHRSCQFNGHPLFASAAIGSGRGMVLSSAGSLHGIDEVQVCISVVEK